MAHFNIRQFTSIIAERVYEPQQLSAPPNEPFPNTFLRNLTPYRLNLLASYGDLMYFPYSTSYIGCYKIHRSNGIMLEALPAIKIYPATPVNNVRVAVFDNRFGGPTLLLTGGSELNNLQSGSLTILQLPSSSKDHAPRDSFATVAHTFMLPLKSAWGLACQERKGLVALTSNSHLFILLSLVSTREIAYASSDEDEISERPAQVVRVVQTADTLHNIHTNNIPCIAFNEDGSMIATASIDSTFALYDIQVDPSNVVGGVHEFLPKRIVRKLCQCGERVPSSSDARRSNERAWVVHWVSNVFVCNIDCSTNFPDPSIRKVWERWDSQHNHGVWLTDNFDDGETVNLQNIFRLPNHPVSYAGNPPLYDDRTDDDSLDPLTKLRIRHFQQNAVRTESTKTLQVIENVEVEGNAHLDVSEGCNDKGKADKSKRGPIYNKLLLVCYEETIKLYRVYGDISLRADEGNIDSSEVELLDSLSVHAVGVSGRRQLMFTSVVEATELHALLVTAIGTGVLLLRIVTGFDKPDEKLEYGGWRRNPSLFVERIFPTTKDVTGVCIVERRSNCSFAQSTELWILQLDGCIECWDLSTQHSFC